MKLDINGELEWQRALGGSQDDIGRAVLLAPDRGYTVLGSSRSNDGDVSGNHGLADIWLAKLDPNGVPIWQRSYGGSMNDVPFGIKPTADGGHIIAGESRSSDGDLSENAGNTDYRVFKLDVAGDIEWQRSYGGSSAETAYDIDLTIDGGYILNGVTNSSDGDVVGSHGAQEFWVVKLNAGGDIVWQRPCGGSGFELGFSITALQDGTFIAFGEGSSNDGDMTEHFGQSDHWLVKLSATGELTAAHTYGGTNTERGRSLIPLEGGGQLLSGSPLSMDGDVSENRGSFDAWFVRVDPAGDIVWEQVFGGSQSDGLGSAFVQTSDGGYVAIGTSASNDGDLALN